MAVRLAVTTTEEEARPFLAALAAEGFEALSLPSLRVEAARRPELARALAVAEDADVIVISSPQTVEVLWPDRFPSTLAAVCGTGTGEAVQKRGGVVWAESRGSAAELAMMISSQLTSKDVALLQAEGADPRVALILADAARTLTAVSVYRLLPEPAARDPVDGVVFTHPSAVDGWLLSRGLRELFVVTVGRATMGALRRHGRRPDLALRRAELPSLAQAIFHATGRSVSP